MKVALVYDWVNKFGGAERVLTTLHSLYPQAPLYTFLYSPHRAVWAHDFKIIPSFVNRFPFLRNKHEWLAPLTPYAFETFDFSAYDLIISVSSASAKGIITAPHTLHLNYCLTPTRFLWSHTHTYINTPLKRLFMLPFISSLRRWDYIAAQRPDQLIPLSQAVASRIRKYYQREPTRVIYPPVDTVFFSNFKSSPSTSLHKKYLLISRLVKYKHIETVLAAFRKLPQEKIDIIGTGSEMTRLKKFAPSNVNFAGSVTDIELKRYYQQAKALIFPQEEDFGLVAVEAQASGLPVIGYDRGGLKEIIIHQKTGFLYQDSGPKALIQAIKASQKLNWYDKPIRQNALRFSVENFKRQFKHLVEASWQTHQKQISKS